MTEAPGWFGAAGPLAHSIAGFQTRPQQQEMAALVESTLAEKGRLVVEAGTGVGKTFAYLVPALLSGRKVIVSTGTKHLQDQLFAKDLPVIRGVFGAAGHSALLKGRANYLCLHRLQRARNRLHDERLHGELHQVAHWARDTHTGDVAELDRLAEASAIWPQVTSTADNCLGGDCPVYQDCFLVKARRRAQQADLVVINHHLFCADLALRDEGFGELLPQADAFIIDEAHQLPEVAADFFGVSLSSRQVLDLARDTVAEQVAEAPELDGLRGLAHTLHKAVADLRLSLGADGRRAPWAPERDKGAVAESLAQVEQAFGALAEGLELGAERGQGLQNCHRRALRLRELVRELKVEGEDSVQWFETHRRGFVLHETPLDIATAFAEQARRYPCAWIFTSATLSVGGRFEHFTTRLGLGEVRCEKLESPYDYARNALLYLPEGLPEAGTSGHTRAVVEAALPLIRASGGRAFMLFTSFRALREARDLLDGVLEFPLLVQGEAPRGRLLERFRALGNGVLLGTSSFWEGVDVRGSALRCVIIDKLPFASPTDPVTQARLQSLRQQGRNPFMEYQLPQAVIALRQGVGRLIRDEQDTGVLMLCDRRLLSRPYGRVFLDSLPSMGRTRDLSQAQAFLRARDLTQESGGLRRS